MQEIIDATMETALVVGDDLILTLVGGDTINAGSVRGDVGPAGAGIIIGFETTWAGSLASIPSGFLHEDGSVLLRASYPDLFDVLGTDWNVGGESGSQFRLPDSRDCVIVGAGGAYPLATAGGSNTHTLTTTEMPSHTHTGPSHTHTTPNHYHSILEQIVGTGFGAVVFSPTGPASGNTPLTTGAGSTSASGTGNTGSRGSDGAHNNMQKFVAKHVIIRAL
jgi:microcystin-dependent protein